MQRLLLPSGHRRLARRSYAGLLLLLFLASLGADPARAATFTVNSLLDTTDGACGPAPGGCTLREAIEASVAAQGRDTIAFDPAVFPSAGFTGSIAVNTLPLIADPAGTIIDGKGATVTINCGAFARCLAFESPAGVALEKVTVANLTVVNVTGTAIDVCGGGAPACDDDVRGVLIENVAVGGAQSGISVRGGVVSKARIVGSVVSNSTSGIFIGGSRELRGARVEGTSTLGSGIYVFGNERLVDATVADCLSTGDSRGIFLQSTLAVSTAKVTDVVTFETADSGVRIVADGTTTGATITNAVASAFGENGVQVYGEAGNRAVTVRGVRADRGGDGVNLFGPTDGATFRDLILVGNVNGLDFSEPGTSVTHTKISDVLSVDNERGAFVIGGSNKLKNVFAAANDSGIVLSGAGGDVVEKSRAMANGGPGIALESNGNVIRKNVALGNIVDLSDDSPTCGTNIWQKNVFRTGSAPCIR